MAQQTQTTDNMALYSQWVRMWNGELELSSEGHRAPMRLRFSDYYSGTRGSKNDIANR